MQADFSKLLPVLGHIVKFGLDTGLWTRDNVVDFALGGFHTFWEQRLEKRFRPFVGKVVIREVDEDITKSVNEWIDNL